MTGAGRNSLAATAEWARRCDQGVLPRLGCPFDPFVGRYRAPGERTLRDAYGKVNAAALTGGGFTRLASPARTGCGELTPDGISEREQRRAHTRPETALTLHGIPWSKRAIGTLPGALQVG
jgi:hypothetical protein